MKKSIVLYLCCVIISYITTSVLSHFINRDMQVDNIVIMYRILNALASGFVLQWIYKKFKNEPSTKNIL